MEKFSDNTPINSNDILASPLWYNPKISKMELNLPNWSKHGITYVGDLIDSNGIFINQKDLEQKYTLLKTNFLEYLQVKMCVEFILKNIAKILPYFLSALFTKTNSISISP